MNMKNDLLSLCGSKDSVKEIDSRLMEIEVLKSQITSGVESEAVKKAVE